jgi:hypothetical protein
MTYFNNLNQKNFLFVYFIVFVILSLIGVFINYSPIPEADFWSVFERIDGINKGNLFNVWQQHNEHRPVLTYLLTYIDDKYIGGSFYTNYFFIIFTLLTSAVVFNKIFYSFYKLDEKANIYFGFLVCLIFFWSQKPNFIFPFHISIIWVNLFSLLALYFFNHYILRGKLKYILISVILSFLSMISLITKWNIFGFDTSVDGKFCNSCWLNS